VRGFAKSNKADDDFDPPKRRGRPRRVISLGTEDSDIPSEGRTLTREPFTEEADKNLLEEGEYIDYDEGARKVDPGSDIYLSQRIGGFSLRKSQTVHRGDYTAEIEDTYQVDLIQETRIKVEKDIEKNF
jgi:hypothetical protein